MVRIELSGDTGSLKDTSKTIVEVTAGDLILLRTKHVGRKRVRGPVLASFAEYNSPERIYFTDPLVLNEPVSYRGQVALSVASFKGTYYTDRPNYAVRSLVELIVGKDNIADHFSERGENWGLYADWIRGMSE